MQGDDRNPELPDTGAEGQENISADLLRGAVAIAEFLLGDGGQRRKIYHLAHSGQLPIFRLGSTLCARRSTLIRWIESQEGRSIGVHD